MLARAMVRNPQALLLDEPTAGLDLLARERLMRKIEAMTLEGIQIILVTHHLEEVIPQVQRVVCLCRGKLFFDSSPENAFSADNLSRLFEHPVCSERIQQRWSARLA
jgi:iron complex transport system ATP-binding protein